MRPLLATLPALMALLLASGPAAAADYQTVVTAYVIRDTLATSQDGGARHALRANPGLGLGLAFDGGGSERLSLDYTDFDLGSNNSLQLLNLNLDHFFPVPGLPSTARLFVGGVAGIGRLDLSGEPGGKTATNGSLGLRVGGMWQLSPQLSLELGGRYLHTGLKARFTGGELAINADTAVWLGLGWRLN